MITPLDGNESLDDVTDVTEASLNLVSRRGLGIVD